MSKPLFDQFDAVSTKQWKQKIQFDLKGADYNQTLIWQSPEGISVKPFYNKEDLQHSLPAAVDRANWKIAQRFYIDNIPLVRKLAISAIERGAETLLLDFDSKFDAAALLEGMPLEGVSLHFGNAAADPDFFRSLSAYAQGSAVSFYYDPLGRLAQSGNWWKDQKTDLSNWKTLAESSQGLSLDLCNYPNAGANRVQELAYALCQLNEYLEILGDADSSLMPFIELNLKVAIGSDYFFEIAKLRAYRALMQTLVKEWGYQADIKILAQPSTRNKTIYDYNLNMLRTTTECMSAVLGGADVVCNLAYDSLYHKDNEFGSRIARNQLLVLKNESYFDWVENPADGSYYVESITHQLSNKALELFKELEASGGFLENLKKGTIQRKIKESADKEQSLFDQGQLPLVGTNIFQNPEDRMKDQLELYPFVKTDVRKTIVPPIIGRRLAENLEKQRLDEEN